MCPGNETDAYKQQIQSLMASNAPVDGIGAQGHFGAVIDPLMTETRLDSLAELGLPIWITEYDSVNEDESIRADNLETLYRLAFSKPAVEGVLMWGFWAGSHWRGSNAAIVNLDWTLNAAGQRYRSLMDEWTTRTNGTSGAGGAFDFRGVHGATRSRSHRRAGSPRWRTFSLDPGEGTSELTLVLDAPVFAGPASNPDPADGASASPPARAWAGRRVRAPPRTGFSSAEFQRGGQRDDQLAGVQGHPGDHQLQPRHAGFQRPVLLACG